MDKQQELIKSYNIYNLNYSIVVSNGDNYMKKICVLLVMIISMLLCSVASAGFNLNNMLLDPAAKQEVQRLAGTYARPMAYINGYWAGAIETAEENDYNKLVSLKQNLNDDTKTRELVSHTYTLGRGAQEKGNNVPQDIFNKYRIAAYSCVQLFDYSMSVLGDEEKPTRNLTKEEVSELNNRLIKSVEAFMVYADSTNKLLGSGSIVDISAASYRNVSVGKKYVDFVSSFRMPGALASSEQKMVNGNIQKVDTYQWKKGKSSVTAVFENGKAISIVPQNLK